MGHPFPNERNISTHDTIDFTENGVFSSFEEALQDSTSGSSQMKKDYDFTQAGNGQILLAKPRKTGHLWAIDVNQGEWVENAQYDPSTGSIDSSQSPNNTTPQIPAGTCPNCSATGVSGKFCNSCGGALPTSPTQIAAHTGLAGIAAALGIPAGTAVIGVGPGGHTVGIPSAGQLAPGASPIAGAGHVPAPAHVNPNRMTGSNKKEVVVPEGMTKVVQTTGFADDLDKLLAEAEAAATNDSQSTS
jgi:hypothetical protein